MKTFIVPVLILAAVIAGAIANLAVTITLVAAVMGIGLLATLFQKGTWWISLLVLLLIIIFGIVPRG